MSSNTLSTPKGLVLKLLEELQGTDYYRSAIANKRPLEFSMSIDHLVISTRNQILSKRKVNARSLSVIQDGVIIEACNTLFQEAATALKPVDGKSSRYTIEGISSDSRSFKVLITGPNPNSDTFVWLRKKLAAPRTKWFKTISKKFKGLEKSESLDLSHEEGTQISNNAAHLILRDLKSLLNTRPRLINQEIIDYMVKMEIDLRAIKVGGVSKGAEATIMRVEYKDSNSNRKQSAEEKKLHQKMIKHLSDQAEKMLPSLVSAKVKKEVLIASNEELKKNKAIKTKGFKIYSIEEVYSDTLKAKQTIATDSLDYKKKVTALKYTITNNKVGIRAIMHYINLRLPGTIAANMGAPALNYRTGRFAQSAFVDNITSTPKGSVSVQYSYLKEPYGVFETGSGSPLANPQRDPKTIIGDSIREIATDLIKAKFFTKRVFKNT